MKEPLVLGALIEKDIADIEEDKLNHDALSIRRQRPVLLWREVYFIQECAEAENARIKERLP